MCEFDGDDKGYLQWLADHPGGYVLNVRRKRPSDDYAILHRVACAAISSRKQSHGAFTERGYRKICAQTVGELRIALRAEGRFDGSFTKQCTKCIR
jgi:hypothetical protein